MTALTRFCFLSSCFFALVGQSVFADQIKGMTCEGDQGWTQGLGVGRDIQYDLVFAPNDGTYALIRPAFQRRGDKIIDLSTVIVRGLTCLEPIRVPRSEQDFYALVCIKNNITVKVFKGTEAHSIILETRFFDSRLRQENPTSTVVAGGVQCQLL